MNLPITPTTNKRTALVVISMVSSLVMLDSNVVAVALPTIARSLHADFADVQWVITAYVLPFAALLLAAGSFSDKIGRRFSAVLGMSIFGLASLACGLAVSPLMLNISRAVQGVGASLVMTASLALINHMFQGGERAKAFAFWGASLGIAITCGPIIGGVIASVFGWTWAFLINVPICAVLILATLKVAPESRDPDATGLDYTGIATFSTGLFLLTWAVIDGNASGWLSAAVLARFIGGLTLLAAFVIVEKRQARPMVDLEIFRSLNFIGTAFATVGYATGAQIMIFYLPLYLQDSFGLAPVTAGLSMLPFALPMFLVPRLVAKLTWAPRTILGAGLSITIVANVALAMLAHWNGSYNEFAGAMLIAGIGAGILNGDSAKAMQSAMPANRSGMGSGVGATIRFTSLLFGVAGLGAILVAATAKHFLLVADKFGIAPADAVTLAKRFAAGDASAGLHTLSPAIREGVAESLRHAFQFGFGVVALTAAGCAIVSLIVMTSLMSPVEKRDAGGSVDEALFVAGE